MTIREQNIERFDAYLAGKLADGVRTGFEKELGENEGLKADFEAYKTEVGLIRILGIREEMSQVMKKKAHRKKPIMRRWLITAGMAAALALAVLFIPSKGRDNSVLFKEYFKPYPNAVTSRADESGVEKALTAYEQGHYEEAILLLQGMVQSDTVAYYTAMCQLALERPAEALSEFNKLEPASVFYEPSVWYKGLSFLLMYKKDSAVLYLKKVDVESPNYKAARELLEALDSD